MSSEPILSVAELNRLARDAVERSLPLAWVGGEVSNLSAASSGHLYFTLKDETAQVRCVFFRSRAQLLGWRPENGQRVEARALATLYEARGDFQLNVETLRRAGTGRLYEQFVRLKIRLDAEGLFDPARRRPLPTFPRRIGIVTSPQAAALRDVAITLRRRSPQVSVMLYPTAVQGAGAAAEIVAAIETANRHRECDLLILCRGGGSIEDLWSFNEEIVARAIRASALPIITGIGHETDTTIADFAADLRAPTPTAAAELAAPDRAELLRRLLLLRDRAQRASARRIAGEMQKIDHLGIRLRHPGERLAQLRSALGHLAARRAGVLRQLVAPRRARLDALADRLRAQRPDPAAASKHLASLASGIRRLARAELERRHLLLGSIGDQLRQLNPRSILERGYCIATTADGKILREARSVEPGARITVNLARGSLETLVEKVTTTDETIPGPAHPATRAANANEPGA